MKEMIDRLRNEFQEWNNSEWSGPKQTNTLIYSMAQCLIAVMERLEAMEQPPCDPRWETRRPEAPDIEAARTALLEYAGDTDCDPESMAGFADGLIAACKREQPQTHVEYVGTVTATTVADIQRAAMINALRWAVYKFREPGDLSAAITRLESGGEL